METPGGSKMVVIRTGVSTAYVAEFRTKLGVDGLDNRAKYQGVLLYRIDTSQWEQLEKNSDLQVISKQYYNDPAVGGPLNKTGVWRPISTSLTGLDTQAALWGPGDTFEDPATGVRIDFGQITTTSPPRRRTARTRPTTPPAMTVTKTGAPQLERPGRPQQREADEPDDADLRHQRPSCRAASRIRQLNSGHSSTCRELAADGGRHGAHPRRRHRVPASAITRVTIRATNTELSWPRARSRPRRPRRA